MVLHQRTVGKLFWKERPVDELSAPELLEALEECYKRLTACEENLAKFYAAGNPVSDGSEDKGAPKPSVSKEFLEEIGLNEFKAALVLEGNVSALLGAFIWGLTGSHKYWEKIWNGKVELSDTDKLLLQSWIDAADYYERNNG